MGDDLPVAISAVWLTVLAFAAGQHWLEYPIGAAVAAWAALRPGHTATPLNKIRPPSAPDK